MMGLVSLVLHFWAAPSKQAIRPRTRWMAVRLRHQLDIARHANRMATLKRGKKAKWFAIRTNKTVGLRRRWRGFASVYRRQHAFCAILIQQEPAATDTA